MGSFYTFLDAQAAERLRWRAAFTGTASILRPCPRCALLTSHGQQQEKKQRAPAIPSNTFQVPLQLLSIQSDQILEEMGWSRVDGGTNSQSIVGTKSHSTTSI